MINDSIVTTLASGIEAQMGSGSDYSDHKLQTVEMRPIQMTDPSRTIAIVEGDVVPLEQEIGQLDPSRMRYAIELQLFAKHADKADAAEEHRIISKRLRVALFQSASALRAALLVLVDEEEGVSERVTRYDLIRVQPGRGTVEKQFARFSVFTLTFDTQSDLG